MVQRWKSEGFKGQAHMTLCNRHGIILFAWWRSPKGPAQHPSQYWSRQRFLPCLSWRLRNASQLFYLEGNLLVLQKTLA